MNVHSMRRDYSASYPRESELCLRSKLPTLRTVRRGAAEEQISCGWLRAARALLRRFWTRDRNSKEELGSGLADPVRLTLSSSSSEGGHSAKHSLKLILAVTDACRRSPNSMDRRGQPMTCSLSGSNLDDAPARQLRFR